MAQGTEFPLRKPAGFHWDLFLLGLTTFVAGLLGLPYPNGLIPQAPFHTSSLCVTRDVADEGDTNKGKTVRVADHVVEQRVSNFAQGLLTLGTMTGPLLIVVHLIPQGVLAGLFFIMGVQALQGNGITLKLLFLARDRKLTQASDPLKRIQRRLAVWVFVILELLGFAAIFAISQTIAAIGFPVIILLMIPFRSFIMPLWFRHEELLALDAPTASPFTMESVGGTYGHYPEELAANYNRDGNADDDNNVDHSSTFASGGAAIGTGADTNGSHGHGVFRDDDAISTRRRDHRPSNYSEPPFYDRLERGEGYELQARTTTNRH